MPGPRNSKKSKKKQAQKIKALTQKNALKEVEQNISDNLITTKEADIAAAETRISSIANGNIYEANSDIEQDCLPTCSPPAGPSRTEHTPIIQPFTFPPVSPAFDNPFITNPGNGPRVKDTEAFLTSFFCPPLSLEDKDCAAFAREEVLTVLEAVLPTREVALTVWYNKTRTSGRICPACQRLYKMGDSLVDLISGQLVDMSSAHTPPQILREQKLSGICSLPCFFLASCSSHPYTEEVALGAWGRLSDELDAQTRSLIDATDPRTAAILRYGLTAFTSSDEERPESDIDDKGLGRVLRMTRRKDLGLSEVLEALSWYETEREKETQCPRRKDEDITQGNGQHGIAEAGHVNDIRPTSSFSPVFGTPTGVRA